MDKFGELNRIDKGQIILILSKGYQAELPNFIFAFEKLTL